ncbi:MAG: deoxynucleoside kinase [Patescibacteria group bacterium]|nr:deoxynucleoside kinase [Patescibacteria group bacterium]
MKKHFHIAVLGNIASGKTTASGLLAQKLKAELLDADLFEENPFLQMYVNDRPRWSFATELYFTKARLKKLANLKKILQTNSVVVDSGLYMSAWVYAKNHLKQGTMTAAEWQFYLDLTEDMKKNIYDDEDLVIILKAPPETLLRRIKERGRDFEKAYDKEYLLQLNDRLNELSEKLRSEQRKILEFDANKYDVRRDRDANIFLKSVKALLKN